MEDLYDPEELIFCPYNKSHHIRRCKMSFHLVKCKANNGEQRKVPCDFNATHMIPEPELQYHHQICPDRKKIEAIIVESQSRATNKFPVYNTEIESKEVWKDLSAPAYDPKKYTENNNVLRHLDVASGAKKKNFRLEERQRMSQLINSPNQQTNGIQSHQKETETVSFPSHRSVDTITNEVSSRSQLKEKLRLGADKVFLQFDGN